MELIHVRNLKKNLKNGASLPYEACVDTLYGRDCAYLFILYLQTFYGQVS